MSEAITIKELKRLLASAAAREEDAREEKNRLTGLIRKLEGVSTPSSARKGNNNSRRQRVLNNFRKTAFK